MLRIEVACADGDQLGEGPLWDVDEQRLYWINSYGPEIHRMEPNGSKKTWKIRCQYFELFCISIELASTLLALCVAAGMMRLP